MPQVLQMPDGLMQLGDGRKLIGERMPLGFLNQLAGATRQHGVVYAMRYYHSGSGLALIVSVDETPHGRLLHVSMSYADHDPTWEEIKLVREAIYSPDVDVMMVLPKAIDYVNAHEHCFHLWQTPVEWDLR